MILGSGIINGELTVLEYARYYDIDVFRKIYWKNK